MRVTEERARASNGAGAAGATIRARRSRGRPTPTRSRRREEIGEALSGALGAEVSVRPARGGGYRAELPFDSREEALELAQRLRRMALSPAPGG